MSPEEGSLGYNSLSTLKMSESAAAIEIPNRALFKATEVCDLVKVQPYVLRSWEAEFPALGVSKAAGGLASIAVRTSSRSFASSTCCSSKA